MTEAIAHTVYLSGSLGIRDTAPVLHQLRTALAEHRDVTLDCSDLAAADVAIVQLIVAARKTAAAEGRTLHLKAPAAGPLRALLQQVGFVDAAGRPKPPHDSFWTGTHSEAA